MGKKIVTIGEIMLRLSPPDFKRFVQSESLNISYGGAEANVAVMLSSLGLNPYMVSQLPDNQVAQGAIKYLKGYGVNTDYIIRKGNRVGLYYFEKGTSIRGSKVIYDRANSAITEANLEDFNFDEIFQDAEWFHFSGITPALGPNCVKLLEKAVSVAKEKGLKISVDLNYRKQLWSYEEFEKTMMPLIKDVDLCIGWLNLDESNKDYKVADFSKSQFDMTYFEKVLGLMAEKFNIKHVATTLREGFSASHNALSAIAYSDGKLHKSKRYDFNIVDRVGAGDSFASGLIYKLVKEASIEEALEFGVAAAAFKHTIQGDANLVTEEEVMDVVKGEALGAVKR